MPQSIRRYLTFTGLLLLAAPPCPASELQVVINEVHYQPRGEGPDGLEFIELRNLGTSDLDLAGWTFTEGIAWTFGPGSVLPALGYLVVCADPARASQVYGLDGAAGPYAGQLADGGEIVTLADDRGELVNRIHYGAGSPWPSLPAGLGPSLEFAGDDTANDVTHGWAASRFAGGTPGAPNSMAAGGAASLVRGVLNESRPAGNGPGFIEIHNPTGDTLALGGQVLDCGPAAFRLPAGTSLAAGAFAVFTDADLGFPVPATGQALLLLAGDGRSLVDALAMRIVPAGHSLGLDPDGSGEVFASPAPTPGAPNPRPPTSPLAINELHFHPPYVAPSGNCAASCSDAEQWLELWNRSSLDVDLAGWSLTGAVRFSFAGVPVLPAGEGLVVAASLAAFRAGHPDVANAAGDWEGSLDREAAEVRLRDPLGNLADRVRYGNGGPLNDAAPEDGLDDRTFRGSPWPAGADGTGRTIELLHPNLDNDSGLAWRAAALPGGTPGAANSVLDPAPGPVVHSLKHAPLVPGAAEAVAITCSLDSLSGLTSAVLEWARDGNALQQVPLRDDGVAPDLEAGDGVHAALVPPQPEGTLVQFRIRAVDAGGAVLFPPAPDSPPYPGFQGPFCLYEVDGTSPPAGRQPVHRVLVRARDLQELRARAPASEVLLPATFIAGGEARHAAGIRYRGDAVVEPNPSFRIELAPEAAFAGAKVLNLNGSNGGAYSESNARELLAADLFRRAGLPYPLTYPVTFHFPGGAPQDFDSRYVEKETYDGAFLRRFFGDSRRGNLYRALVTSAPGIPDGDLSYLGPDPAPYRAAYEKLSNLEEDDYSDLIALTRALDPAETPDAVFAAELAEIADAAQWARFFALQSLLANGGRGIWSDSGQGYFLYRVPAGSPRPDAGKFLLLPWDLLGAFGDAGEPLFRPALPAVRRFLTHASFARLFHRELATLVAGAFSRLEMRLRFAPIAAMFPAADVFNIVDPLDTFVTDRLGFVKQNVADRILAGPLPQTSGAAVISPGDIWRYFRGGQAPPGGPTAWTQRGYADAAWENGPTGIGYGDGDDATVLTDMVGNYTTVFTRRWFIVADPGGVTALTLSVNYDDAFVAYVNGAEVARSANAPGNRDDPVPFDAEATGAHEASPGGEESFPIDLAAASLVAGENVLAVVVLNAGTASGDLSFIPTLFLSLDPGGLAIAGGCGGPIHATGSQVLLGGLADPVRTRAVRVNGSLAALEYVTGGAESFGLRWQAAAALAPGENEILVTTHADEAGQGPPLAAEAIRAIRHSRQFTEVGGVLPADAAWTAAGGPYRLTADLEVPQGRVLTIEPGAVLLASGGRSIVVRGRLEARGSTASPIVFNAFACEGPWGGILFAETGTGAASPTHVLADAVIEHAAGVPGQGGVIVPATARLLVEGCTFRALAENAIEAQSARLEVRDSLFDRIYEGVHATTSTVFILDSTFRDMIGDNDAIDFDFAGVERSRVARCLIAGSTDDGLDLAAVSVDIEDNVFLDVADKAISLEGNGSQGPVAISGNLLAGCGTGMALKDGVNVPDAHHNTITECEEGIHLFAKDAGPQGGHGVFHSTIVWNNVADVKLDDKSTVDFNYSDVGGGAPWPGTGNILAAPRFASTARRDYSLAASSPCIGAGRDGTDMGAVPFSGTPHFVRGDATLSGSLEISDPIATLLHLFSGRAPPLCLDILDANDDGRIDITDPIYTLRYLFQGGPPIPPPAGEPGPDPTPDGLACG
jgi:hypothetical protein